MSNRRYVAACVLLAASATSAQRATFIPADAVSFTISTDRNFYTNHERITVRYQIKNVSKGPLYVPKDQAEMSCSLPGKGITSITHVDAWFENLAGKDSFGLAGRPPTFAERMRDAAVLLRPGEHFDGTIALEGSVFKLSPGGYRIEAKLDGWKEQQFSEEEQTELSKMGAPFLHGEIPASFFIIVTH